MKSLNLETFSNNEKTKEEFEKLIKKDERGNYNLQGLLQNSPMPPSYDLKCLGLELSLPKFEFADDYVSVLVDFQRESYSIDSYCSNIELSMRQVAPDEMKFNIEI